jgi:hypothetical protein
MTWSSRQEQCPSKPEGFGASNLLTLSLKLSEGTWRAKEGRKETHIVEGSWVTQWREWEEQPWTEATASKACGTAWPSSLIDALLITSIKANIWAIKIPTRVAAILRRLSAILEAVAKGSAKIFGSFLLCGGERVRTCKSIYSSYADFK